MNSVARTLPKDIPAKWQEANPNVGGGYDSRSSENGLLSIFYGSLDKASQFEWLNAGRTLVDKTYINILWQATGLSLQGKSPQELASNLDQFIRMSIAPIWDEIDDMTNDQLNELAIQLVSKGAEEIFGASERIKEASILLFYLCPQLPVFPMTDGLMAQIGSSEEMRDYSQIQQTAKDYFIRQIPHIYQEPLPATYGNDKEKRSIDLIIKSSNWWQRRCLLWMLDN